MCAYACVCVYSCLCFTCVCLGVCVSVCLYACVCVCVCVCFSVCVLGFVRTGYLSQDGVGQLVDDVVVALGSAQGGGARLHLQDGGDQRQRLLPLWTTHQQHGRERWATAAQEAERVGWKPEGC